MAANPGANERTASQRQQATAGERVHQAVGHARTFWERVTEGERISELWTQFQSEARTSYGLYSREVDWDKVDKSKRWQRPFRAGGALFWAMLMKLTPARRLLLLLAVVAVALDLIPNSERSKEVAIRFPGLAVFALFLLLALELADRVTMKRDLEIAREIQRWLVPEKPPDVPGYDIAFMSRPANTVAGDYYDTIPRGVARNAAVAGGKLLLVVADVAGKSVPAALLMATFQASLRAIEATGAPLDELVQSMNFYVCENSRNGLRFVTSFFAELEPATGAIRYTSAGHHPAMVRRTTGKIDELAQGGMPLGIEFDEKFPSGEAQLGMGEVMFIYTDGLVEAVNSAGAEFGKERLENLLFPCDAKYTAVEVLAHVTRVLDTFVGAERQHDDITCMVVRRAA
jgi:phosphoserine phosphatase RsbU/P